MKTEQKQGQDGREVVTAYSSYISEHISANVSLENHPSDNRDPSSTQTEFSPHVTVSAKLSVDEVAFDGGHVVSAVAVAVWVTNCFPEREGNAKSIVGRKQRVAGKVVCADECVGYQGQVSNIETRGSHATFEVSEGLVSESSPQYQQIS
ncbi:hypothetical protein P691DRAFT_788070 [Macrolepiota fuliginosa MF-IS2]|uniref:Uncharacterized protein n=1 Tax=Macrolepiota fuliginosa MF-IS2 TaxID=1400762 RepID=A0A9P5X2H8_9AGAR|nr:hypothetical protein P691DRAFT_788070 [Macrolepiota fuliginosa MF-IS2]